jgi:hypothetical protein
MPTQTILSSVLSSIFAKMGQIYNISIGKCRRDFVAELFRVVLAMRGRVNFTNMARFSRLHEQTSRRPFAKVPFAKLNQGRFLPALNVRGLPRSQARPSHLVKSSDRPPTGTASWDG